MIFSILSKFLSTLGFIGYIPLASGTFGTLISLILMALLKPSLPLHIALSVFSIIIGVISSNQTVKLLEGNSPLPPLAKGGEDRSLHKRIDPQYIVIDEFTGYIVSLLFLPLSWGYMIVAFILFRFLDIIKPPPIKRLEHRFKGGIGIMADDIGAAIYTNLVLQVWKSLN